MKWHTKLGLLGSLLLGMDILKWLWGAFLIVTEWHSHNYFNGFPAVFITESPLMLLIEIIFILCCMALVVIALIKKDE